MLLACCSAVSGLKSYILHFSQVSLPTWVSKTFRLTENNLFSCHLGLLCQLAALEWVSKIFAAASSFWVKYLQYRHAAAISYLLA